MLSMPNHQRNGRPRLSKQMRSAPLFEKLEERQMLSATVSDLVFGEYVDMMVGYINEGQTDQHLIGSINFSFEPGALYDTFGAAAFCGLEPACTSIVTMIDWFNSDIDFGISIDLSDLLGHTEDFYDGFVTVFITAGATLVDWRLSANPVDSLTEKPFDLELSLGVADVNFGQVEPDLTSFDLLRFSSNSLWPNTESSVRITGQGEFDATSQIVVSPLSADDWFPQFGAEALNFSGQVFQFDVATQYFWSWMEKLPFDYYTRFFKNAIEAASQTTLPDFHTDESFYDVVLEFGKEDDSPLFRAHDAEKGNLEWDVPSGGLDGNGNGNGDFHYPVVGNSGIGGGEQFLETRFLLENNVIDNGTFLVQVDGGELTNLSVETDRGFSFDRLNVWNGGAAIGDWFVSVLSGNSGVAPTTSSNQFQFGLFDDSNPSWKVFRGYREITVTGDLPDDRQSAVNVTENLNNESWQFMSQLHNFSDDDWLFFVAPGSGTATISIDPYNNGLDPGLGVYDASGNLITFRNGGSYGISESATVNISAGSPYYIKIDSGNFAASAKIEDLLYRVYIETDVSYFLVSAYAEIGGGITPDGPNAFGQGSSQWYRAMPDQNFRPYRWFIDGVKQDQWEGRHEVFLQNISANQDIRVSFLSQLNEPGNDYDEAYDLGVIEGEGAWIKLDDVDLSIYSGDVDFFKFEITGYASDIDFVRVFGLGSGTGNNDLDLAIGRLNNQGNFVPATGNWQNSSTYYQDTDPNNRTDQLSMGPTGNGLGLEPGEYYAIVYGSSGLSQAELDSNGWVDFSGTETGTYKLGIRGPVRDRYESDDTALTGTDIPTTGVVQHHSMDKTDEDWVKFTLNKRSDVVIRIDELVGDNNGTQIGIGFDLYNASLELINGEYSGSGGIVELSLDGNDYLDSGAYFVRVYKEAVVNIIKDYTIGIGATISTVPEIDLQGILDDQLEPNLLNGTDFGAVIQGSNATQTYNVFNSGGASLTLGAISLPLGFTLITALPSSLAAGDSASFTIKLDTTTPGEYSGQVSFDNNDRDEGPFNFQIAGIVLEDPTFDDHGDDADSATHLPATNDIIHALVEFESDEDWFSFDTYEGYDYIIVTNASGLSGIQTTVFDVDGQTEMATENGTNSIFKWTAPTADTYFVKIVGPPAETGAYDLGIYLVYDGGLISQVQWAEQNHSGETWYKGIAKRDGYFTVEAFFENADGDINIEFYDATLNLLSSSQGTTDLERVDTFAAAGETYYFRSIGENPWVEYRATNLVWIDGSNRIRVNGTANRDAIEFQFGDSNTVTVNGTVYNFDPGDYSTYRVHGGGGNDLLRAYGGSQDQLAILGPTWANINDGSSILEGFSAEEIRVFSGSGTNEAHIRDSAGDDLFNASPDQASMFNQGYAWPWIGSGYRVVVDGFNTVIGYGTPGGNDVAVLADSPGMDIYYATPTFAVMKGETYSNFLRANDFFSSTAISTMSGDSDEAYFVDSDGDDSFIATASCCLEQAQIRSFQIDVGGIGDNGGDIRVSGTITVDLLSNKVLGSNLSVQRNQEIPVELEMVVNNSNSDEIDFFAVGSELYFSLSEQALSYVTWVTPEFRNDLTIFKIFTSGTEQGDIRVEYRANGIVDYWGEVPGVAEYLLGSQVSAVNALMTGPGYSHQSTGFEVAVAKSLNGGDDQAEFVDSTGNDNWYASPDVAQLTGDGFFHLAVGFDYAIGRAINGGFDVATYTDSAGDDQFTATPAWAQMIGTGFNNRSEGFQKTRAYALRSESGDRGYDRAFLFDSVLDDTFTVYGENTMNRLDGTMTNGIYTNLVDAFEEVTIDGSAGGINTLDAVMTDLGYVLNFNSEQWT